MSKSVACSHCHLEFSKNIMIKEDDDYFCCKGCQGVYHLLKDEGLDSFYAKTANTKLSPPKEQYEDSSNFNSLAFYERFVTKNSDGFCEISLIIEGIHCSACVWLNEKVLHKMEGVLEASINFTNNKAKIEWADDIVKLSQIIDMIRAIGYNAFPYDSSLQEAHANKIRKDYYLRMAVAIFASMNIMWIAVAQYAGYFSGIAQDAKTVLNIAEGVLATPVLFYSGWVFFRGAYYGMKNRVVNMDSLVATGASLTYVYSLYVTFTQKGEAYFDSVSMIITFVLIGKFLEVLAKKNASDTLDTLSKQIPNEVNILKNDSIVSLKLEEVNIGDTLVVSSGERVLLDGILIQGSGSFDESSLTGESNALYKKLGDKIISGTTSIDADIYVRVTKVFKDSTLSHLVSLLESAMSKKPKIEQLANRLSEHFSTLILLLSIATFFIWWLWPHSFETSMMVGISVIIIACPCALGLATPVATLIGLGIASKRGILFKEARQLETMAKADVLVLDKTGTLTIGRPQVVHEEIYKNFSKTLLAAMVKRSNHPVSLGILEYLKDFSEENILFESYEQINSKGIIAFYKGSKLVAGNKKIMQDEGIFTPEIDTENTHFYFAIDGVLSAHYALEDSIKEGAKEMLKSLQSRGLEIIMLTGDNKASAKRVAKELGITKFEYEFSPEDKLHSIEALHAKEKVIVMVGDGVNDILSLAKADIGIVMGSGSDIAIEVGDVILLNNSLSSLKEAFQISATTYKLIKENFFISFVYNAITIPLAMAGYIIPLIAALSMSFSSLLVVGNSLRIKYKYKRM